RSMSDQLERFARTATEVPLDSILRITMNSNPSTLGKPEQDETSVNFDGQANERDQRPTEQGWRLARFRERLGSMFPSDLDPSGMTYKQFGKSVLAALRVAVERELLNFPGRKVI